MVINPVSVVESVAVEIKCWQMQGSVYRVEEYNWLYILPGIRQWSKRGGGDILYEGFGCDHWLQVKIPRPY